jgi:hypothetical protein
MSYYNGSQIPLGTKMKDLNPRPKWLEDSAASRGFSVGDLVLYKTMSYSAMTIHRVVEDCPANGESVWHEYRAFKRSLYTSRGWVDPVTHKPAERRLMHGYMILLPVFSMENTGAKKSPRRKKVPYFDSGKLKKIDILELAQMFSRLNDFVMSEAKRLSE